MRGFADIRLSEHDNFCPASLSQPDVTHKIETGVMASGSNYSGLEAFVSRRGDLVALANTIVRNHAVAEELVQDSWLQWSNKSYPSADAVPILKRIVLNLARDWHRRQRREWARFEAYSLLYDDAPDTERVVIARQDLLNVVCALQTLSSRSLHAFRLSRVDGLTYAQIGAEMGVATSTAYGLVADALVTVTLATRK
ncbi:MAG: RNA polymerase sigma factor [Pseudomonadota bacterium]